MQDRMTIDVYHHAFGSDGELVATVATTNLEEAFRLTNTIDNSWWENPGVEPHFVGRGCRSTSAGDVLVTCKNGERVAAHRVADFGFEEI
jgi:hypothetical protein